MFPDYLDGAKVLEYTGKGHFGFFTDYDENNDPVEKEICYFAICRYEGGGFYVFSCDSRFDVLTDSCLDTVKQCKESHPLPDGTIWHTK